MLIRLTSMDEVPLSGLRVKMLPEPGIDGRDIVLTTDQDGFVRTSEIPPKVFRIEAKNADGTTLSSRPIARPASFASKELTIKLHLL